MRRCGVTHRDYYRQTAIDNRRYAQSEKVGHKIM